MMKFRRLKKADKTQKVKDIDMPSNEVDPLTRYLEGIGTSIGRILLNRQIDDKVINKFDLKKFKNAGRYYTAKLIGRSGQLADEVLIDKQTGRIQSVLHITGTGS